MSWMRTLPLLALFGLTACAAGVPGITQGAMPIGYPSAAGLSGLLGSGSSTDATIGSLLAQAPEVPFPARVGVVFYNYQDPLQPTDTQNILNSLGADLTASGFVKSTVEIPTSLVTSQSSVDTIRTLAARFQVDIVLIVSGQNQLGLSGTQPQSLFSNAAAYESHATLSGLALGVLSGTFLTPINAAGTAGSSTIDPADPSAAAAQYQLVLQAQTQAMTALKLQFLASLKALDAQEAAATPAPTPSTTPTPAPTASPVATP